jgi:hypothetical protein
MALTVTDVEAVTLPSRWARSPPPTEACAAKTAAAANSAAATFAPLAIASLRWPVPFISALTVTAPDEVRDAAAVTSAEMSAPSEMVAFAKAMLTPTPEMPITSTSALARFSAIACTVMLVEPETVPLMVAVV